MPPLAPGRRRGRVARRTARPAGVGIALAAGLALAAAVLAASAGRPFAQDGGDDAPVPIDRLEAVERELETGRASRDGLDARAAAVADELDALRAELVDRAARALEAQERVTTIEREIADLARREAESAARLADRRDRLGRLIGGLQRLALVPGEALVARAADPTELLRGGLLLRAAVPRLEAEAASLREALDDLAATRTALTERRAAVIEARARLEARRTELDRLIGRREALLAETRTRVDAMDERLARLAREAEGLRELVAGLEGDLPPRPDRFGRATTRPMPEPAVRDGVLMPTAGPVRRDFGAAGADGDRTRGLTLAAEPGAPVVAPLAGSVRFAGPFRGYGRVLILEHPGGYHSTLAGLGRIDVRVGESVLAGEPVGRMPAGPDPDGREADVVSGRDSIAGVAVGGTPAGDDATKSPSLYFEFRHDGQPINPIQGLARAQRRGRG